MLPQLLLEAFPESASNPSGYGSECHHISIIFLLFQVWVSGPQCKAKFASIAIDRQGRPVSCTEETRGGAGRATGAAWPFGTSGFGFGHRVQNSSG